MITALLITILLFISSIIFIDNKVLYEISLDGKIIGYVKSKSELQEIIDNKVLVSDKVNAIVTTLNVEPECKPVIAEVEETDEDQIVKILSENTTTVYEVYEILVNNDAVTHVNTSQEAEKIVDQMKEDYSELENTTISAVAKYTEDIDNMSVLELAEAQASVDFSLREIKTEQEKIAKATCNGIYLEYKPVIGIITSRYGVNESIRDHAHGGLDISAPNGTDIMAVAAGTVSFSGWYGGYGNFIIIDHGNGVQTCYGHCSKLYVEEGATVEAGQVIAAVGTTGYSTGNHLHLELRVDGNQVNPQTYLYN